MTTARTIALSIIDGNPNTAMLVALDIVRIVADERLRRRTPPLTIEDADLNRVVATVCEYYRVPEEAVRGRKRDRRYVEPRQMLWLLLYGMRWSYDRIGTEFGRHHASVMDGCKRARRFERELEELTRRITPVDVEAAE